MDLGGKKNALNKQIELSCGFGGLRTILNDCEEIRNWEENGGNWKAGRSWESITPQFRKKMETI